MSEQATKVQWQNGGGNWVTQSTLLGPLIQAHLTQTMKNVARMHPDKRIRAVDQDGRLVDIL